MEKYVSSPDSNGIPRRVLVESDESPNLTPPPQRTFAAELLSANVPVIAQRSGAPPEMVRRHLQTGSTTLYFLAQCPKCKTVETLQFIGNTLSPSRKFRQKDGGVYHDCGSDLPCRLHR